jgi:hypothetical protein
VGTKSQSNTIDVSPQQLHNQRDHSHGLLKVPKKRIDFPSKRAEIFDFLTLLSQPENLCSPPHEHSFHSTSAESKSTNPQLLRNDETRYLEYYGKESFVDMQNNEFKCQFPMLMQNQEEITRHLRASVIDWLFEVGTKLQIDDKGVIFQAINLMDRYFDKQQHSLPSKELQLTAVTALFVASKNLEVDPLDLQTCAKTLCFNKYGRPQFLKRETDIRLATQYENESPTILDFVMFYIRLIKLQAQKQVDCLPETQQFISDMTTITYDLCKSVSIDANLFKYRPSILAAALTFIGFQLQFELMLSNGQLCTR